MAFLFSKSPAKTNNQKGFTLIELLTVIAIVGLLSALGLRGYMEGVRRAKVAQAQGDLDRLKKAVSQLEFDTGRDPGGILLNPCVWYEQHLFALDGSDGSFLINIGLQAASGAFAGWKGPYIEKIPKDPWNMPYYFDGNYQCMKETTGCKAVGDTMVRAMFSGGANKSGGNTSDKDNVVVVLSC